MVGALFFGRLSDRLGRRKLFMVTLAVYLVGRGLTALTPGQRPGWIVFLYVTRFIAGMGIGGEYAAINSAIDELIPARYRGRVDIAVNGTYWAGAIIGTLGTLIFLNALVPSAGLAARLPDRPGARPGHHRACAGTCRRARAGRSCTATQQEAERTIDDIEERGRADRQARCRRCDEHKAIEIRPDRADRLPRPAPGAVQDYPGGRSSAPR